MPFGLNWSEATRKPQEKARNYIVQLIRPKMLLNRKVSAFIYLITEEQVVIALFKVFILIWRI